ncbi:MAG: hypothetical protein ACI4I6_07175 [Hominimerdicola sp.]
MIRKSRILACTGIFVMLALCLCSCGKKSDGVTIDGTSLEMPCKISSLGGKFEYAPDIYFQNMLGESNQSKVMLTYNGNEFGLAQVDTADENKLSDADISALVTTSQSNVGDLKIYGIGYGSTRSDVLSALDGKTDDKEGALKFYDNGYKIVLFFDTEDKVSIISVSCENK